MIHRYEYDRVIGMRAQFDGTYMTFEEHEDIVSRLIAEHEAEREQLLKSLEKLVESK